MITRRPIEMYIPAYFDSPATGHRLPQTWALAWRSATSDRRAELPPSLHAKLAYLDFADVDAREAA